MPVELSHEEVTVTRHAVDRPVQAGEQVLEDGQVIRVPVREETVDVQKQARVTGEVEINKQRVTEQRQVSDTVRREQVDVQTAGEVEARDSANTQGTYDQNLRLQSVVRKRKSPAVGRQHKSGGTPGPTAFMYFGAGQSTLRMRNWVVPASVFTSTSSPILRPIKAAPMGEAVEILPWRGLASAGLTMRQLFFDPLRVLHRHGAPDGHRFGGAVVLDHAPVAQSLLDAADLAFQKRLLALGVFVFTALADVPIVLGAADALRHLAAAGGAQKVQPRFQLCFALRGKRDDLLAHRISLTKQMPPHGRGSQHSISAASGSRAARSVGML